MNLSARDPMLADADVERIRAACHPDPFAVLGVHADAHGALRLRCFVPGAATIELLGGDGHTEHGPLQRRHADGFFEGACPAAIARDYRLRVRWADGTQALLDDPDGFEWIEHGDAQRSVLAFVRRGRDAGRIVVAVCNFTPTVHHGYRIGVPEPGVYRERINTDSAHYGGSNVGSPFGEITAEPIAWHGRPHSIGMSLPPLATVLLERRA